MLSWRHIVQLREHSLSRNVGWLILLQLANYIVPLIILPLLTRKLGLHSFGIVALTLAAIQIAFVLTDYGFSLSATYGISKNRDRKDYIDNKISSVFAAKFVLVGTACALMIGIPLSIDEYRSYLNYFLVALIAVVAQAFQPTWLFQGIERMQKMVLSNVCTKFVYAALVLIAVDGPEDAILVIYFWGGAQVCGLIASLYLMHKSGYRLRVPSLPSIKKELRDGANFFWSRIAVSIYTSASALIVGLSSTSQVAQYAVCEQIYKAGQNLTSPINSALFPYMAKNKNWSTFYYLLLGLSSAIVLGCLFLYQFSAVILTIFFGPEYASASPLLGVFLCTVAVNYISVAFGYPAFSALGKIQYANYSVIAGALLHFAMLSGLYFLSLINAYHVAITVLITETFVLLFRLLAFFAIKKSVSLSGISPALNSSIN